jgi:hypothetical protein
MIDLKFDWSELENIAHARDEIMEFARVEFAEDFYPMGLCVRFETDDGDLLQAARESFGRYPRDVMRDATRQGTPDMIIRLCTHAVDDKLTPEQRGRSIFRLQDDYFYVSAGRDAIMVGDRARGRVVGFLPRSLAPRRDYIRAHFVEGGFYAILMSRGFVGIHSAGLVKDGHAVLIRARPGGGKSTLAYACLKRGYQLLGEDKVWVHWNSPEQEWWGAPWTLSLLPEAKNIFPELAVYPLTPIFNGELKMLFDIEALGYGAIVRTPPGVMIFLERHDDAASYFSLLELRDAHRRYLDTIIEPPGPSHVGYVNAAEQLLARPSYVLRAGRQLDAAVDALDDLLHANR